MILCVVAVYDSAVQAYNPPVFIAARGAAVRGFIDHVRDRSSGNTVAVHPEDFELRLLAMFDDATGLFHNGKAEVLIRGKDVEALP